MRKVCQHYIDRFFARSEYAYQTSDGNYYVARNNPTDNTTDLQISPETIMLGLHGHLTIATYITSPENKCKFITIDFDEQFIKMKELTQQEGLAALKKSVEIVLYRLEKLGLKPVLEFSGWKGYHVFVLFDSPIDSEVGYEICQYVSYKLDFKPETFPKQAKLHAGLKYGSQIKIPLMVNKNSNQRSQLLDRNFEPYKQQFTAFLQMPTNPAESANKAYEFIMSRRPQRRVITGEVAVTNFDDGINPFEVTISSPGERHKQQAIFVLKCLKKGWSHLETRTQGIKWLEQNQNNFSTHILKAESELEDCIVQTWRKYLNQDVFFHH